MRDAEIAELIVAGDPEGLGAAYHRYADRLYDYCAGLLSDRDAAADAVHDTFLIARQRAAQLRDPGALRPWLYAIARSRCLRGLRERARFAGLEEAPDVGDESAEPVESGPRRAELRELVRTAVAALNPREQEVINLSLRHELGGPELAAALGVPPKQAHAVASTARAQLERALGTLVLSRTRGKHCAELRALLADWDGTLTPLWRKRIQRHTNGCEECSRQRKLLVSPAALLGASPILIAPPALFERTLVDAARPEIAAEFAANGEPRAWRADGFPAQHRGPAAQALGPAATRAAFAAAAMLALVLFAQQSQPLAVEAPAAEQQPAEAPGGHRELGADPGSEQGPAGSPAPVSTRGGPAEAAAPASAEEAAVLLWARAEDATGRECVSVWSLVVTAGTSPRASAASAQVGGGPPIAMRDDGSGTWQARVDGIAAAEAVEWQVDVTDVGGGVHTRAGGPVAHPPCPEPEGESPDHGTSDSPGQGESSQGATSQDST